MADSALVPYNVVTTIDWGDNLESKDWKLGAVVRVETGCTNSCPPTMKRYAMCYISGSGTDEMWGMRVTGPAGGPLRRSRAPRRWSSPPVLG